jgi:hypothetical protein
MKLLFFFAFFVNIIFKGLGAAYEEFQTQNLHFNWIQNF